VLAMQGVRVIRNGEVVADVLVPPPGLTPVVLDSTLQVPIPESSWLAVEAYGQTNLPHAVNSQLFAHTGAVYVDLDGQPVRRTADAAYFLDWLDTLQSFIETRDHWQNEGQHQDAVQFLAGARAFYLGLFRVPPGPFALLTPALAETIPDTAPIHFDWADAQDPEPGDRITYTLSLAPDSLFTAGWTLPAGTASELDVNVPIQADRVYWWRVRAIDRAGNATLSTPERSWFRTPASAAVTEVVPGVPGLRLWPNPATGRVWLRLAPSGAQPLRIEILDASGRRVGGSDLLRAASDLYCWPGRDAHGRAVPSGLYWVRVTRGEARPETAPVLIVR
jgi:hypothetical protein